MRSFTATQTAVMLSPDRAEHVRVFVWDTAASVFRNLCTYAGFDMVLSARWSDSIDNVCAEAEVELIREQDWMSCAPLMQSSPLNLAFTPGGSYSALIKLNQLITIDVAVVPADSTPVSGDWMEVFRGYIDEIDVGGGKTAKVHARDGASRVVDAFIEEERVYGVGTDGSPAMPVGARVWAPSVGFAVGEYVIPTDANRPTRDNIYKCTTAGTTYSTEPTWPASSTVTESGGLVWTYVKARSDSGHAVQDVMASILTNNAVTGVELNVPSSPGWTILSYMQERTGVFDAIRKLAQQIGWDVRYKYHAGDSDWYLTLYEPARATTTALNTFTAADYSDVSQALQRLDMIRNVVRIVYCDGADVDAAGNRKRKSFTVSDSTSITNYGRRFMEIAESSTSNIDSFTEALRMATAALDDLKNPVLEHTVTLVHGYPWVELGDLYQFNSNDRHYSANQKLAVVAYDHTAQNGGIRTRLVCRGSPTLGVDSWHSIDGRQPGVRLGRFGDIQQLAGYSLTATPIVGGARLSIALTTLSTDALNSQFSFHISTSSSFAASTSNKVAESRGQVCEITTLLPGTTYYAKAVPITHDASGRVVLGPPTPEVSFVAGRSTSGHLDSVINFARLPLNGLFETRHDASGMPDHWTVSHGAYGTRVQVLEGDYGSSGNRVIRLVCTAGSSQEAGILSSPFTVYGSTDYGAQFSWYGISGTDSLTLAIRWYTHADAYISEDTFSSTIDYAGYNVWWTDGFAAAATSPATARFARMQVRLSNINQARDVRIDDVLFYVWGA